MDYSSASTFSRVDKAWPPMSESTQARIQRLRELEQIRLQKQAALLAQRNSEPVPIPKYESRITSSKTPKTSSNETNKINTAVPESSVKDKSDEYDVVKSEITTLHKDDEETTVTESPEVISEIIEIHTAYLPSISTEIEDESDKENVEKPILKDNRTAIKADLSLKTNISKTISESPRMGTTSYVSGPLSPTSTEKTRISVVRKTKLDSLPSVKTIPGELTSELVQPEILNTESSSTVSSFAYKKFDVSKTNENKLGIMTVNLAQSSESSPLSIDDSSLKSESQSCLTLPEIKGQSEIREMSKLEDNSETKTTKHSDKNKIDTIHSESKNATLSVAMVEIGPSVKSPPIQGDETETEPVNNKSVSTENNSCRTISTFNVSENNISTAETKLENTAPHSSLTQSNIESKPTLNTLSDPVESNLDAETSGSTVQSDTAVTKSELAQGSEDAQETIFRLGTLALKQTIEVTAKIDEQFSAVTDNVQKNMAKLEELERQRIERKKALEEEKKEDLSHLPVRERIFRNQSVGRISRPVRQQSIPEQIRASRQSRRNSDMPARADSPGKAAEAESPPLARRSRLQLRSIDRLRRRTIDSVPVIAPNTTAEVSVERIKPKPVLDIDSLEKAFGRPEQERLSRLEELERLRRQGLAARRDSAPTVGAEITGSISARIDFPSTLIVNRGSSENIAQFPIHEHVESSFPLTRFSSTNTDIIASRAREIIRSASVDQTTPPLSSFSRPILRPSYSESRLFPLDGGRLSQPSILSMSTETEQSQIQQVTALDSDAEDTPVYMNGAPQGTPLIDNEGRTHWVAPTSPRLRTYLSVMDRMENRNRSSSFESSFGIVPSFRHRAINQSESLLDVSLHDHFLADCFLKKYTLKERCALIRDKIYDKPKDTKNVERGNPDGASHDCNNSKNKTDDTSS